MKKVELLFVVAVVAILATAVFLAINPANKFSKERNLQRHSDISNILTSIQEYQADNEGNLPLGLSKKMGGTQLGSCNSSGAQKCHDSSDTCVNLNGSLAKYLKSIPVDPSNGTPEMSGYSIEIDGDGIITLTACLAENGETIQLRSF